MSSAFFFTSDWDRNAFKGEIPGKTFHQIRITDKDLETLPRAIYNDFVSELKLREEGVSGTTSSDIRPLKYINEPDFLLNLCVYSKSELPKEEPENAGSEDNLADENSRTVILTDWGIDILNFSLKDAIPPINKPKIPSPEERPVHIYGKNEARLGFAVHQRYSTCLNRLAATLPNEIESAYKNCSEMITERDNCTSKNVLKYKRKFVKKEQVTRGLSYLGRGNLDVRMGWANLSQFDNQNYVGDIAENLVREDLETQPSSASFAAELAQAPYQAKQALLRKVSKKGTVSRPSASGRASVESSKKPILKSFEQEAKFVSAGITLQSPSNLDTQTPKDITDIKEPDSIWESKTQTETKHEQQEKIFKRISVVKGRSSILEKKESVKDTKIQPEEKDEEINLEEEERWIESQKNAMFSSRFKEDPLVAAPASKSEIASENGPVQSKLGKLIENSPELASLMSSKLNAALKKEQAKDNAMNPKGELPTQDNISQGSFLSRFDKILESNSNTIGDIESTTVSRFDKFVVATKKEDEIPPKAEQENITPKRISTTTAGKQSRLERLLSIEKGAEPPVTAIEEKKDLHEPIMINDKKEFENKVQLAEFDYNEIKLETKIEMFKEQSPISANTNISTTPKTLIAESLTSAVVQPPTIAIPDAIREQDVSSVSPPPIPPSSSKPARQVPHTAEPESHLEIHELPEQSRISSYSTYSTTETISEGKKKGLGGKVKKWAEKMSGKSSKENLAKSTESLASTEKLKDSDESPKKKHGLMSSIASSLHKSNNSIKESVDEIQSPDSHGSQLRSSSSAHSLEILGDESSPKKKKGLLASFGLSKSKEKLNESSKPRESITSQARKKSVAESNIELEAESLPLNNVAESKPVTNRPSPNIESLPVLPTKTISKSVESVEITSQTLPLENHVKKVDSPKVEVSEPEKNKNGTESKSPVKIVEEVPNNAQPQFENKTPVEDKPSKKEEYMSRFDKILGEISPISHSMQTTIQENSLGESEREIEKQNVVSPVKTGSIGTGLSTTLQEPQVGNQKHLKKPAIDAPKQLPASHEYGEALLPQANESKAVKEKAELSIKLQDKDIAENQGIGLAEIKKPGSVQTKDLRNNSGINVEKKDAQKREQIDVKDNVDITSLSNASNTVLATETATTKVDPTPKAQESAESNINTTKSISENLQGESEITREMAPKPKVGPNSKRFLNAMDMAKIEAAQKPSEIKKPAHGNIDNQSTEKVEAKSVQSLSTGKIEAKSVQSLSTGKIEAKSVQSLSTAEPSTKPTGSVNKISENQSIPNNAQIPESKSLENLKKQNTDLDSEKWLETPQKVTWKDHKCEVNITKFELNAYEVGKSKLFKPYLPINLRRILSVQLEKDTTVVFQCVIPHEDKDGGEFKKVALGFATASIAKEWKDHLLNLSYGAEKSDKDSTKLVEKYMVEVFEASKRPFELKGNQF
ncbi:hypothetical protein HDV01_006117 [Terramyces sp. JEL0728]|nr:hypothetical protein HDV01_006117 [Terramyces sp. JEL0728]